MTAAARGGRVTGTIPGATTSGEAAAPADDLERSRVGDSLAERAAWAGIEAERLVSDVETLKALSDPLRLKILEAMVARMGEPWSVKELAAALGVPQTRLYHHIELLVERDLVRAVSQRVVSGIIETRYRVAAMSLRLDHRLLASDDAFAASSSAVLANVLDTARAELDAALREAAATEVASTAPDRPLVTRGLTKLTPGRAAELRQRLEALLAEFEADTDTDASHAYSLLLALYRSPTGLKETSGD
jgi:DNA-binding transcriptional ArsR family regulator